MPVITCSCLPNQRFGNALFIYAFARAYAEAMDCDLVTPPWIGQKIFQNVPQANLLQCSIRMSNTTLKLPKTIPDHLHPEKMGHFFGQKNIDLVGYFQNQKFIDFYSRMQVKEWFKLKPEYDWTPTEGYSAQHHRRGDYQEMPFKNLYASVTTDSYDKAIEKFQIPKPVWIVQEGFTTERPMPANWDSDKLKQIGAPWLPDFVFMRNAVHLLRANSSFSWWAATLGSGKVYSPVVGSKVGWQDVPFVEGNHEVTAGIFKNQSSLVFKES